MATQTTANIAALIREIWVTEFYANLRQTNILASIFNRPNYSGALAERGDTVKVPQVSALTASVEDIGGSDQKEVTLTESALNVNQIEIVANKMAHVSVSIGTIAQLQGEELRAALREEMFSAISNQIEATVAAGLVPSASSPAHGLNYANSNTPLYADFIEARRLLGVQRVPKLSRWALIGLDSYATILQNTIFTSADKVTDQNVVVPSGEVRSLAGFATVETDGISADKTLFLHPSCGALDIQKEPTVKISDQHAAGKLADLFTVYCVYGFKLMDNKRFVEYSNSG